MYLQHNAVYLQGICHDDKFRRGFADLIGADDAVLAQEAVTDSCIARRAHVIVLTVRSAELMESITKTSGRTRHPYGAFTAEARLGGHDSRRRRRA